MNKRISLKTSVEVYNSKLPTNVNESVTKTEDGYMVKSFVEVPQSLVRAIVSKAKTETGKDPKEMLGDTDIAELIVQYLHKTFLNADSIPSSAVLFSSDKKTAPAQPVQPAAQPVQPATQPVQPVQTQEEEELPIGTVENINIYEHLSNIELERMYGLSSKEGVKKLREEGRKLYKDLSAEGFMDSDIDDFLLNYVINKKKI